MFRARLQVLNVCSVSIIFIISIVLQIKTGFVPMLPLIPSAMSSRKIVILD